MLMALQSMSPFVIAASAAGLKGVPSLVNAIVITSAWSAQNQALLAGTRVLYGLALKRQAPRVFLKTTSWGVPWVCVLCFTAFMFLAFMSLSEGALTVFWWLVDLTACGVLISWSAILLSKCISSTNEGERLQAKTTVTVIFLQPKANTSQIIGA